jgi:MerR family copper efflux transcriptional regulator
MAVLDNKMLESMVMRITEAAQRLGSSPRMLRYRDSLGLLPVIREGPAGRHRHRQFGQAELDAVSAALRLEQRYDISPAALAFGLRVLADPSVRAAVTDLGRRVGRLPSAPERALDFEKERALRLLSGPPRGQERLRGRRAARIAGSVTSASSSR